MEKFDWYQGTFHDLDEAEIVRHFELASDLAEMKPSAAKNGYETGVEFSRAGRVICKIWWGGNPGVHVIGTGADSPWVAEQMRKIGPHQITRVDSALDLVSPGLFTAITGDLIEYAKQHDIVINQQGDWARGQARTLYLGAPSSVVRLVVYEKGYEAGGDLNWVRFEARARPKGRDARSAVSRWEPKQVFGASAWLTKALEAIGWAELVPESIGSVWKPSDAVRARRTLLKQYGAILANWAEETTWASLGHEIAKELETIRLESAIAKGEQGASGALMQHLNLEIVDTAVDTHLELVDTV